MLSIIIGNLFTIIATAFSVANGTRKNKKEMLWCDIGSATFYTASDLSLKGYSGAVQNVVGILRDLTALYLPNTKYTSWIFVALGVIFGVYFNNRGLIGLLPVASSFYYSLCVIDKKSTPGRMKIALILNSSAFALYSIVIYNFVGIFLNGLTAVTTTISYIKDHSQKENKSA